MGIKILIEEDKSIKREMGLTALETVIMGTRVVLMARDRKLRSTSGVLSLACAGLGAVKLVLLEVGRRKNYYERPREDAILMTSFFL